MNEIGEKKNNLSRTWYFNTTDEQKDRLRKNYYNYSNNVIKPKTNKFYWTTFRPYMKELVHRGYLNKFVTIDEKPKQKYNTLAFLGNSFANPYAKRELGFNDEQYAIRVLVKWITNVSDINKPIHIYIPSARMRRLLYEWLDNEYL